MIDPLAVVGCCCCVDVTATDTAVMDSYICLIHLLAGIMWEALFNSFATISFTKLMLFSILEMRLMLMIWKARRADAFNAGWEEMRRQLSILYARFYGALIIGLFLMYQFWVRCWAVCSYRCTPATWPPCVSAGVCVNGDGARAVHA